VCGRVIQSRAPIRYVIVDGLDGRDSRVHNHPPRWNGAPGQDLLAIRRTISSVRCRSIAALGLSGPTRRDEDIRQRCLIAL
jgi:hypothetical protein